MSAMSILFSELRSPQVAEAAEKGAVLVLPFGQTEEHGSHLPIHTDLLIARRICEDAVTSLGGHPLGYVLDPIAYGFSQKVLQRWPGTFTMPQETVIAVVRHVLLSLVDMGFKKLVVVSTHGNHVGVTRVVARMVADERGIGPGLAYPVGFCSELLKSHGKAGAGGSCHAGEFETSVMLHLAPHLVDMSAACSIDNLKSLLPYSSSQAFVSTWTIQQSETGTYGDPTVATAKLGKLLFEKMVTETANFIRYYHGLKQV